MKSHYQLLGIDPVSDIESIKKAFRREIARYHPDKVIHLGPEFQAMASTRAAELTAAYTTLTNASSKATYDAALAGGAAGSVATAPEPPPPAPQPRPAAESRTVAPETPRKPPAEDSRGDIVRRAALGRLRAALAAAVSDCEFVSVSGFDLACVSRLKASLFRRTTPPSVLVRLAAIVDRDIVVDAYAHAVKARLEQKPIVLLLVGDRLAPTSELSQAIDEQRRRHPALVDTLLPVPVDIRDWAAKIPANVPASVKTLIESLKSYSG